MKKNNNLSSLLITLFLVFICFPTCAMMIGWGIYYFEDVVLELDYDRMDELLPFTIFIDIILTSIIICFLCKPMLNGKKVDENRCDDCGKKLKDDYKVCPYCGKCRYITCPYCKKEVKEEFNLCPYCGKELYSCAKCGRVVKDNDIKCPGCGHKFE